VLDAEEAGQGGSFDLNQDSRPPSP
jgi:hypothetical protein